MAETTVTALLGLFTMAAVFEGYHIKPLRWWERAILLSTTVLLLWPSYTAHMVGVATFIALCFWQKISAKTEVVAVQEKEYTNTPPAN